MTSSFFFTKVYENLLFQTGQVIGRVNLVSGHVKTQLIAHDKEVYDIAFSRGGGGKDMFASVGMYLYSKQKICLSKSFFFLLF